MMTDLKTKLDAELSHISLNLSEEEIIAKAKRKPSLNPTLPRLVAALIVLVLLASVCFAPNLFSNQDNGFMIVANAQTLDAAGIASAEKITSEEFVELKSIGNTMIFYDFNNILNEKADDDDLTQKYLFHSFAKLLHIDVVGKNIDTVSYKLNKGVLCVECVPAKDRYEYMQFDYRNSITEYSIDYDKQENYQIAFNPVNMLEAEYDTIYAIREKDSNGETKVVEYTNEYPNSPTAIEEIGRGFKSSVSTVVTNEEIKALKSYIEAEDMVGFYNYRNKIFERLVNDITLDITVTKANGDTETKTLQLRYNPVKFSESNVNNHYLTGTISAKIIEI